MKKFFSNKITIIILLMISATSALAEYRVYQYFVKSRLNIKKDQKAYAVTSTLDPVSYLAYHGGGSSIQIDLVRTWLCPGHTGMFRDICDGPLEKFSKLQVESGNN